MTSIKPILTFLRNAHFLHGFIATVIAFNVIGNGTIWLLVNDPSDLIVMPMMPFIWLLISIPIGIGIAFAWDDMEQRRAKWDAYHAQEQEHRDMMLANGRSLKAFYQDHPDFLGVIVHSSLYLELRVKAAPYGHPFPHKWDGVEVKLVVEHCDSWGSWGSWDTVKAS